MRVEPLHRTADSRHRPPMTRAMPALVELIRAEIERDGPITFARFMERALYEPGLGYYATSADRADARRRFPDRARAPSDLRPDRRTPDRRDVAADGQPAAVRACASTALEPERSYRAIVDGLMFEGSDLADDIEFQPIETEGRQPAQKKPRAGLSVSSSPTSSSTRCRFTAWSDAQVGCASCESVGRLVSSRRSKASFRTIAWQVGSIHVKSVWPTAKKLRSTWQCSNGWRRSGATSNAATS